jgi:hypothetical protein
MHDWLLEEIIVDWSAGFAVLQVVSAASERLQIRAAGLKELHVQRWEPWGPTRSIDRVDGPLKGVDGASAIEIQMQTGDVIRLTAREIAFPARSPSGLGA